MGRSIFLQRGLPVCKIWKSPYLECLNLNIYQQLVKHFNSQLATAAALNVDQSTVSGWVRGKHGMSAITAIKAERLTGGAFKATQLCSELSELASAEMNFTQKQDKQ